VLVLLVGVAAIALSINPARASHETDWDVLVNGQPFHGEGNPRLEGCSIILAVSGLTDAEHMVAVEIALTDPSGDAVLASDGATVVGTSWDATYALDDAVIGVEPHAHGHHVVITLTIDDVTEVSRPFWLACGAATEGNPFHVVFDVAWELDDGTPLDGPPPDLDRESYALDAESTRGTAHCSYAVDDPALVCTYANHHGHEDESEALIVPAGEHHTFTVTQTSLGEAGSNVSGLGTFLVRSVCPREDEHTTADAGARAHDGSTEDPCHQLVTNVVPTQQPTTTTSTTTSPPTTVAIAPSTGAAAPPTSQPTGVGPTQLPATGGAATAPGVLGVALLSAGVLLWHAARRAPTGSMSTDDRTRNN
jgi:hypothetical protein